MLARPKKSSYIVKKEHSGKITNSKLPESVMKKITKNAELFKKNNLNQTDRDNM